MPILRRAYLIASPVWVATLPLATYAATRVHASHVADAFALAIYGVGTVVCHQLPDRSFHLWGAKLPVCARCTGVYLGAALGVAFGMARAVPASAIVARRSPHGFDPRSPQLFDWRSPQGFALLAVIPTAVTVAFEWTTGVMPSNTIRFLAGLPLGAVVSWLLLRVN